MMDVFDFEIGKLARENFAIIQLFYDHNIDFFCKGDKRLKEAMDEANVDEEKFLGKLEQIRSAKPQPYPVDIEQWPPDLLADYIQKTHHRFTEATLLEIRSLIRDFPADGREEAETIATFSPAFELLAGELATHMKKEELMLFPAIKRIAVSTSGSAAPITPVKKTIGMMTDDHDRQYQLLKEIRKILNSYAIKEGKDEYNKIMRRMQALDKDLPLHIHLENNLLFPKAIEEANK